jgi:hypothetical protein
MEIGGSFLVKITVLPSQLVQVINESTPHPPARLCTFSMLLFTKQGVRG